MNYMMQMLIAIPVVAVIAIVVLYFLWWRQRKKDKKQEIIQFTTAGTIERDQWIRDLHTAKNNDEQGSVFCDIDAYRRRASGNHEMVQFCHQSSAVPAYPGDDSLRKDRLKFYHEQMTNIAVAWADRDAANVPRLEAIANNHQLYKLGIMGAACTVLIICTVALLFSGRLHWPF